MNNCKLHCRVSSVKWRMYSFFLYLRSLKIATGAVICDESILKGDITIGSKTVVHPRASIIAEAGPIFIGEGNIIEEMATIINRVTPGSDESEIKTQVIGNYNVFEIDSTCEALKVGDNNILETKGQIFSIYNNNNNRNIKYIIILQQCNII